MTVWGRKRYGDVRCIHELELGRRRIDMVMVAQSDIVGFEIKGPRDRIDDRLAGQLYEYALYLPEVWLVVAEKWRDHPKVMYKPNLLVVLKDGTIVDKRIGKPADRDEMCCSRLLERLWNGEAIRIALRLGLIQPQLASKMPGQKVKNILARLLTGHEIMKQVCIELRARSLTGIGSDPASGEIPKNRLAHRPEGLAGI